MIEKGENYPISTKIWDNFGGEIPYWSTSHTFLKRGKLPQ